MADIYPAFHLTAITHRRDAVYPATIVGMPPMEDFYIGSASVKLFLPVFKMTFPELVDLALPAEGVFHNLVFVSIKKTYPMQAFKIMHGLWGMGQMMFTKYIVVVDEDVNVHNTGEVLFRLCATTDPQRDTLLTKGPADVAGPRHQRIRRRLQNGFRRHPQTPRRRLQARMAAADQNGRRGEGEGGKTFWLVAADVRRLKLQGLLVFANFRKISLASSVVLR